MGESAEQLAAVIGESGPTHGDPGTGPSLGIIELEFNGEEPREKPLEPLPGQVAVEEAD